MSIHRLRHRASALSLLVASLALVAALGACGGGSGTAEETASQPAQEVQEDTTEVVAASAAEEQEEPQPQEDPVEPRETKHELEGSSAASVEATNANGVLTQAIGNFEDKGYTLAFMVRDMTTGNELVYNGEEELYPASSIKAPFTTSVYEQLVETGQVPIKSVIPIAEPTILESSDEGYRTLHRNFGEQHFIQWLKDADVEPGSYGTYENMVAWNYPHICARQLALMWVHIFDYLQTDTEPAQELASLLANREVSSLRKALGDDLVTWSKMGWFESFSDYRSEPATVEAGVVFSEDGPYVFAVMTTAPALLDELVPIHQAIYRAHRDMV